MEFDREVFDLMPSGSKIFNLIGLKMPSDKDIFFRAKQKETLDKYQAARRLCMNWKLTIGITIFTN